MSIIVTEVLVDAPIERVFDLSTSIDFHAFTQDKRYEKPVSGITSGMIHLGQSVTWEAIHFGIRQNLTAKITEYDRPNKFTDTMIKGAFYRFEHSHIFEDVGNQTQVKDVFDYDVPFSLFGKIFDKLILHAYMKRFFIEKNAVLKQTLESQSWQDFI